MKKEKTKNRPQGFKACVKRLVPLFIVVASFGVLFIIFSLIRKNPKVADFFTMNVSRPLAGFMGRITSVFPFSVFELFVVLAIIAGVTLLVLGIIKLCKKRFYIVIKGLCIVSAVVLAVLNWYTLTAGFAYYRSEFVRLPMTEAHYENAEFVDMGNYFIDDFIYLDSKITRGPVGNALSPYSIKELAQKLQEEFNRLDDTYFFSYTPKAKPLVNSWFMSSTSYAGVSFLPFGEPTVNRLMPPSSMVHTMAHEIAHTKGVMRENEANLVAYYILLSSDDEYLRYCGYYEAYGSVASLVALGNNYDWDLAEEVVYDRIPASVSKELSNDFKYWMDYVGPFDFLGNWFTQIGDKFNEWYLKINGADDGMGSYNNPWDAIETGETDPETEKPIIVPVYSNIHKILFALYDSRVNLN